MRDYWDLHTEDGESIPFPEEGQAVVNAEFARRNGYELGDTISLSDEDGNELSLRIVGLSENYIYNYLYLSADSCESQNPRSAGLPLDLPQDRRGSGRARAAGAADELDAVSSVTVNADTLDRFDNMMSSMNYIVLVIIVCAARAGLHRAVQPDQHQHHRARSARLTIKVLGFYPMEVASYVFRENFFLTAIGGGVGLLLGKLLHWFVMEQINIDMVCFQAVVQPVSYLYSFALTFLFACIVNAAMFGKLDDINMAESLKSIE